MQIAKQNSRRRTTGGDRGLALAAVSAAVLAALVPILVWAFGGRPQVQGDSPKERIACISRLATSGRRGAGAAIARAAGDPHPGVRRAAVVALGGLSARSHRRVIASCMDDTDAQVRAAAAATAGACADDEIIERLGTLLNTDPDARVRRGAALGLARDGGAEAVVLLVRAIETNPPARAAAMNALMDRFHAGVSNLPDPGEHAWWVQMAARIRGFPSVRR